MGGRIDLRVTHTQKEEGEIIRVIKEEVTCWVFDE